MLTFWAGLTRLLLGILRAPNFWRDSAGPTSFGKSSELRAAASCYGLPDERDELPPAKKKKLKLPPPSAQKTYSEWNVEELSPHPRQAELPATTDAEGKGPFGTSSHKFSRSRGGASIAG